MGHIKSQYMTGVINMIGLGVPQDKTQVFLTLLQSILFQTIHWTKFFLSIHLNFSSYNLHIQALPLSMDLQRCSEIKIY